MGRNLVSVLFESAKKYPQIRINGEEISRYASLSDEIFNDIFVWGESFFRFVDEELNDAYDVELVGQKYQYQFLLAAKKASSFCENILFEEMTETIALSERYNYATRINAELKLGIVAFADCLDFNCAIPEKYQRFQLENISFNEYKSDFYICNEGDDLSEVRQKYVICVAGEHGFEKDGMHFIVRVPIEHLQMLIDYLNRTYIQVDFVARVFEKANHAELTREMAAEFEAYSNEKQVVFVNDLPTSVEAGSTINVKYTVFPACLTAPKLFVTTENPAALSLENGVLLAKEKGTSRVALIDSQGAEYFSAVIGVIKHVYVESISIIAPHTNLQINDSTTFKVILKPNDAEDADQVTYRINNENVAVLTDKNEIYALADGKFTLTVSTSRASKSVDFQVIPQVSDLMVSSPSIMMYMDTDAAVSCSILPANVTPKPSVTWTSSNSEIIQIKRADGYDCVLHCRGLGSSVIVCQIDGTNIKKQIMVSTPPPKKGCYIATSVYGSYDCPEVWVLRRFRDNILQKHLFGRLFVRGYYALSPTLVRWFGRARWFNKFWGTVLDRFVKRLKHQGIEDKPYQD